MDEAIWLETRRDDAELLRVWIEEQIEAAEGPERWVLVRFVSCLAKTLERAGA